MSSPTMITVDPTAARDWSVWRSQPGPEPREIQGRLRELRVELLERLAQQFGHRPVAVLLVVGRHHVPRCGGGVAALEEVGVRRLVLAPPGAFVQILLVELPV